MRALTLRNVVRFGMMAAAIGGVTFAAGNAQANDVDTGSSAPAAGGSYSSMGSAALRYEQTKGLPTSIRTDFKPISLPFGIKAQVNVGIKIDPVKNGGPLYIVDMPKGANIEANWGSDKKILLKAQTGSQTDGLVTVRHTLAPSVDLAITGPVSLNFAYDATSLVNKIPGAKFAYDSKAQQPFAPWGFTAVDTKLTAPDLANATLFSLDMDKLPDFVANNVDGYFGVKATTKPTFSYKTTKIVMSGADGEISNGNGELSTPAIDGDFMEVMASVEGVMDVKGSIAIHPFVHFDKIASFNLSTDLGLDVYNKDYTTPPEKVVYQTVMVHIPMPNVHVPTQGVNIGNVKTGGSASKTIQIENSGEKEAVMTFKSSDAAFSVPNGSITVPAKSSYELVVKFSPDSASPASSEITVMSSDADSPEQMFKIGANGADVGGDDKDGSDLPGKKSSDDGCGCKAAGTGSSIPSYAGFGLLALGAVVLFRRRKSS